MPRHHTVPEVYLKAFYDPAKVAEKQHVLRLYEENRKIRPRGADAVAAVDDFNLDSESVGKEDLAEPMTEGPDDRGRVPARTVRMMTDDLLRFAHCQVYASFFCKELQARVNRVFKEREPLVVPMPANYRRRSVN